MCLRENAEKNKNFSVPTEKKITESYEMVMKVL